MTKPKSQQGKAPQLPAATATSGSSDKVPLLGEYIGRELKSMFRNVVAEPVPDRFRRLLEELEKKQTKD